MVSDIAMLVVSDMKKVQEKSPALQGFVESAKG